MPGYAYREDQSWATFSDREICEKRDRGCNSNTDVRNAFLAATEKNLRSLLVLSDSEEVPRSSVQESVGRRGCRCQNDNIDDRRENRNARFLDSDDPWRTSSSWCITLLSSEQSWIIGSDKDTVC